MKLHILSDLHNEFELFEAPQTNADVVILAGDIHVAKKGIDWAIKTFPNKPVIYVLGNHEYYGRAYPKHIDALKCLAQDTNIHILEKDSLVIDGVTFLGCTLWTNFELFGAPKIAGYEATQVMTDYRKIRVSPQYRKLRSLDTAIIHRKSLDWLTQKITKLKNNEQKFVVITHHAPSKRSIAEKEKANILSAAYASHLDDFVAKSSAMLWIHGHIHHTQNYFIGQTRVIANPKGYPDELNPSFIPDFLVEV
ncbi:metallophosphoesterase [[Leptolyngbya] sp. PCC 7376]|uniref:metallophosphoesterase n=1 Tax=[Leptolyngbya] sp. PCC 7376 TaxID=111781 RepID=UPI00029F4959|nr:metallophosphoesterase [[Leptolyngbya] sp. PCC 7376]AFY36865.1 metallophosphoesterase [[Leptolyngbya] sp. PCC 7376]